MAGADDITKWQQSISQEKITEDQPLIAHLYEACSGLYRSILAELSTTPSTDKSALVSLQRSHSYLVIWGDGYGVSDGLLDSSLDKSRRARGSTLRLLCSVSQTLTKRLLPVLSEAQQTQLASQVTSVTTAAGKLKYLIQQDDSHDSDSDTSSETSSTAGVTELDEIAEDLGTDTQCLMDLGSRFNEQAVGPTIATEAVVDPTKLSTWDPSRNFIDRVRWRFPRCDEALIERLGKANWARVLKYQEVKNQNIRPLETKIQSSKQSIPAVATKSASSKVASTTFHESGLGTSIPSGPSIAEPSQYAETVVSYKGGNGESVRVPSLPEGAKNGIPFNCVACSKTIVITSKSAWKKHLFLDLMPYMCLDGMCRFNQSPFPTRAQWEDHFVFEHGISDTLKNIDCPLCKQQINGSREAFAAHVCRHMEEIALTVLPTNPDSEDGTDIDSGLASSENSGQNDQNTYIQEPNSRTEDDVTYTSNHIDLHLLSPLLADESLRWFQIIVLEVRERMHIGMVLRDVEDLLLSRAQQHTRDPELYQRFGIEVLRRIKSTMVFLQDADQVMPHQQPYDDEYLLNLERQILRVARWMLDEDEEHLASSTSRLINPDPSAEPKRLIIMEMNAKTGPGGLEWETTFPGQSDTQSARYLSDLPRKQHENHKPVHEENELLHKSGLPDAVPRAHNVKTEHTPPLDHTLTEATKSNNESSIYENLPEQRRRHKGSAPKDRNTLNPPGKCREPGCDKEFRRACDLTKHEKTHSRVWKCPVPTCKYHDYGWPTEKELDRHVSDKHTEAPAIYKCLFQPCSYTSKRESNCKQHMEKAHGWIYVRSKSNGKNRMKSNPIPKTSTPNPDPKLSDTLGSQLTDAAEDLYHNHLQVELPSYDASSFDDWAPHGFSESTDLYSASGPFRTFEANDHIPSMKSSGLFGTFEVNDQTPSMNDSDFTSPLVDFPSTMGSTPNTLFTPASIATPHGPEDSAFKQQGLTSAVELFPPIVDHLDEGFDVPATTLDSNDDFVLFPRNLPK